MNKITKIKFDFEDGSTLEILDKRAVLIFQSRVNSSGILSGLEDALILNEKNDKENDN